LEITKLADRFLHLMVVKAL